MDALPRVTASRQLALTLLLAAVIAATYGFGVYLFPVVLPAMKHDLGFGYAQAGYITAARQIANVLVALLSGLAASRFGAARVMLGATALSAVGLACLAFADHTWVMGVVLVALNAFAAATWVPMMALVAPLIDERHQAKAIGVIGSGTNYGVLLNGLMVPGLMAAWGWRSVWLVSALFTALLSVVILLMFARLGRPETRVKAQPGVKGPRFAARTLFSRRWQLVYAIALLSGFAGVPFITYFSAYAHDDLHLGLDVTAHAWALVGFVGAVSGLTLGMIGDARSSASQPQRDGMRTALVSAGILLLCASLIAASRPGVYALMIAAVAFGFSFFPLFGLLHAYVGKTSEPALAAIGCGICEASFGAGGALGNVLGGLCKSVAGSFQPVYFFAAGASVVAIALSCFMPGVRRAESTNRCTLADAR
ncbi:MFS transporter [Caballeronia sordidicola]|uniref:Transporter n=1 Tax=Caballeronia sordidicola TaxID=196367 RepID=A0A242ML23_CABSO|nr:MFS transporter [Caballeronia sordidicola]OTP71934.1 Transporter [Caballeronia sordidicola]